MDESERIMEAVQEKSGHVGRTLAAIAAGAVLCLFAYHGGWLGLNAATREEELLYLSKKHSI